MTASLAVLAGRPLGRATIVHSDRDNSGHVSSFPHCGTVIYADRLSRRGGDDGRIAASCSGGSLASSTNAPPSCEGRAGRLEVG
jgi:hypothetical protein